MSTSPLVHLGVAVNAVEHAIDALGKQEAKTKDPDILPRMRRLRFLLRQLRSTLYLERKAAGLPTPEIPVSETVRLPMQIVPKG
jgi:hypothetical protein